MVLQSDNRLMNEIDRSWRDLSYDIGWESSDSGIIRCHSVLNRRTDISGAVEGLNLRTVRCDSRGKSLFDLLREGRALRHVQVRLPKKFGPDNLYVTAKALGDGRAVGTFSAVESQNDAIFNSQIAFLTKMSDLRNREEAYRQEAEVMLQGLRLLLGTQTTQAKLEAMSDLMLDAIKGSSRLVLRVKRDGAPRVLDGSAPSLPGCESLVRMWQAADSPVTVYGQDAEPIRKLRKLLGETEGDVASILLPFGAESIVLICGAGRRQGFAPENIGLASRFALILRQALILKEEQDKLVQSAKLSVLGQMSAGLAHELRQPLNTISMATQNLKIMAEGGAVAPDRLAPKLARILGQVERASQIMDRVRRFSRKSGEDFASVDLAVLAQGIEVLTESALVEAGVRLKVELPPTLSLTCDGVQIEQVLANLVRNAIDALSGVGSDGKISNGIVTIRGERTEHGVVLRVEDNGPGFPSDVIDKPLETFFTTKSADSGTGLGLSICNTIAREHGGKLALGNHSGGAYVELHLPERSP
jgi:signal transduction histidine kinase